jgi:hypothetical protein
MAEDQILLRQYLLGELDEEAQHLVEERLFTRDEYLDETLMAEDELIDAYLGGSLSARELSDFERHFLLTTERRRKLRFALSLKKYVSAPKEEVSPELPAVEATGSVSRRSWTPAFMRGLRPAAYASLMATLLLLVAFGSWLLIASRQRQQQRASLEAELMELNRQQARGTEATPAPNGTGMAVLTLTRGMVRGGGELRKAVLDEDARVVQLRLELPSDEFQSYRGVLQTEGDERVVSISNLRSMAEGDARVVILNLPSKLLADEDYRLLLKGESEGTAAAAEDVATYRFRVTRKRLP